MTEHSGQSPPAPVERPEGAGRRLRVLIIEDHADTAQSMAMLLELYGHDARVASDGLAALRALEADLADVVLLDIGLPGMDGWEVARRIRECQFPKTPFLIAVSGYGDEAALARSRAEGIHVHLVKPVDPAEIHALLQRFQTLLPG